MSENNKICETREMNLLGINRINLCIQTHTGSNEVVSKVLNCFLVKERKVIQINVKVNSNYL